MQRADLEHLIRAASAITRERDLVIVGSQAIHGAIPEAGTKAPELCFSKEADMYPLNRPDLSELIEGAIGRGSAFEATFGYYADGVGPETAILPAGWEGRLVKVENANTGGGRGYCLEPHDLAVSKLAATREKDYAFVDAMLKHGYINAITLRERAMTASITKDKWPAIERWIEDHLSRKADRGPSR